MRFAVCALVVGLACIGVCQSQPRSPGTTRIMRAMVQRYSDQKDYWFKDGEFPVVAHALLFDVEWRPYDYDAQTSLGWMYGNMEMYDVELAVYTRYRAAYPKNPEAAYPLAEFYFKKRSYAPVIEILEPTIRMETKPHANSYRLLAHAYDRVGLYKESLAVWETFIKMVPDDAAAKVNRDKVRKKLGG